jgi:Protein of unknown function (DUF2804)
MTTTERELTEEVDLCEPDGKRLNPAARGWSRRPLHRANLAGRWGRTKRWDYWAVLSRDMVVSVTYADIDYLGLVGVEWIDLASHRTGGRTIAVPLARGVHVPDVVGTGRLAHHSRNLGVDITYRPDGTHVSSSWTEADGSPGILDLAVADSDGHDSLNVVIPWTATRFQYTSKHQARPATGTLTIGDRTVAFGHGDAEAWGVFDAGRGRWPYRTTWNWGGGAGRTADGTVVGLQFGGKWTDGTGFTENGVLLDGRLMKIGADLIWDYRWDDPMAPWRVHSPDGSLDVTLTPVHDRHARTNAAVLSTEVHQVFGHWTGTIPADPHGSSRIDGLLGFAEESRSRW